MDGTESPQELALGVVAETVRQASAAIADPAVREYLSAKADEVVRSQRWPVLQQTCWTLAQQDGHDIEKLLPYTAWVVVAAHAADADVPTPMLRGINDALDAYRAGHLPNFRKEIAEAVADAHEDRRTLRQRVGDFADCADHADTAAFDVWLADLDLFTEAVNRGEYSVAEVRETQLLVGQALTTLQERRAQTTETITRLTAAIGRQRAGGTTAQLMALEKQWLAYRVNAPLSTRITDLLVGAAQTMTVLALRTADAYCWSRTCVEAVAAAAESLPDEACLSPESLGALAGLGTAGWWWFDEPVPVQTLRTTKPVCALLWRRQSAPDGSARGLWFSCMVMADFSQGPGGRADMRETPTPWTAWMWPDGSPLGELPGRLRDGYRMVNSFQRGEGAAGIDVTVNASLWFSKFFLAGAAWLRQRIVGLEKATGVRNVARSLEREHKLAATPTVQVVHLRQRDVVHRATAPEGETPADTKKREYSCRWVVRGFFRNQWYPSRQAHELRWIDAYVKGPDGKPLREVARVYAVER